MLYLADWHYILLCFQRGQALFLKSDVPQIEKLSHIIWLSSVVIAKLIKQTIPAPEAKLSPYFWWKTLNTPFNQTNSNNSHWKFKTKTILLSHLSAFYIGYLGWREHFRAITIIQTHNPAYAEPIIVLFSAFTLWPPSCILLRVSFVDFWGNSELQKENKTAKLPIIILLWKKGSASGQSCEF